MNWKILGVIAVSAILSCTAPQSSKTSQNELSPRNAPVQVAEIAPDFTLEDQHNRKVTLSEALVQAPVMLVFYRGNW